MSASRFRAIRLLPVIAGAVFPSCDPAASNFARTARFPRPFVLARRHFVVSIAFVIGGHGFLSILLVRDEAIRFVFGKQSASFEEAEFD